ncbi:MAG: Asp-tRNA(Asn)/Glu-tRNA(Gln) amidotransferase subunit GatC [Candidatus Komeilibacteria bacterium]|jgi:aspartyl-tRNA(Asn)/glutamyl-tRNA(Gln) amidotransferase subunit C|nr:Asp-tRNA(Asn)/Glu-tRNA(Gln) amidotransferase subunit GatC [Candidatus Komeilibacteria bacterium]MBT4447935.1 Asp-tRNA(Asn)/Glu-tRNA(Gln) amidotransferase subunit GatC [Candidatus Komeilibacteria bacterium]
MKFDKKQLLHLADLAKLKLNNEEITTYNAQLKDILGYVDKINKLDLSSIKEGLTGAEDSKVGPRPDSVEDCNPEAISQACQKDGKYVAAPNVFNK